MKFYIDIALISSMEIPLYFLREKVFQQIHLAFVENQYSTGKVSIGVAFPEYNNKKYQLGSKIRLLAFTKEELENLDIDRWLFRLKDYVHCTSIKNVPEIIDGFAFFKRVQKKSSNSRLARRKAKRENISYEEALIYLNKRIEETSKLPYIQMRSLSSDKKYRLIIGYEKTDCISNAEGFSTYGLSSKCSIPIF